MRKTSRKPQRDEGVDIQVLNRVNKLEIEISDQKREYESMIRQIRAEADERYKNHDAVQELTRVKFQLDSVQKQLTESEISLVKFRRAESLLVDVLAEIRFKTWKDTANRPDISRLKYELSSKDLLSVLDILRSSVRLIVDESVRRESEMLEVLHSRETQKLNHRQVLEDEVGRLRNALASAHEANVVLEKRLSEAEAAKQEVILSSAEAHQKLLLANAELDRLNQEKTQELATLEGNHEDTTQTVFTLKAQLAEVPKLKEANAKAQRRFEVDLNRERSRIANHVAQLEKQTAQLVQENARLQQCLHDAEVTATKAKSMSRSWSAQKLSSTANHLDRQVIANETLRAENEALKKQLMQSRTRYDDACTARDTARAALEKATHEMKRLREENVRSATIGAGEFGGNGMDGSSADGSTAAGRAAALGSVMAGLAQKRLVEKEQEVATLRQKLRRLLISEKRGQTQNSIFDGERARYEAELMHMRCKVNEANDMLTKLSQAVTTNSAGGANSGLIGLQLLGGGTQLALRGGGASTGSLHRPRTAGGVRGY